MFSLSLFLLLLFCFLLSLQLFYLLQKLAVFCFLLYFSALKFRFDQVDFFYDLLLGFFQFLQLTQFFLRLFLKLFQSKI